MGRLFAGLLSFVVGVQFTIGTLPFTLSFQSAQAQTCGANQKLDPIMGRCLSTAQASQVSQATAGCASAGDEAAQKKCYLNAAEASLASAEASGDVKESGKVSGDMLGMIMALGGLTAGVGFLASGAKCGPLRASAMIIAASSVAAFMGEILAAETYKNKMKKANETLAKINAGSQGTTKDGAQSNVMNATNVQEEAFKALIEKEEAVIAAANTKKKLYTLAMAGYAAAMVMAGIEVIKSVPPFGTPADAVCAPPSPNLTYVQTSPNKKDSMVLSYIDNYFKKNQRVKFSTYTENKQLQQSADWRSLQANVIEINLLRSGYMQSPDLAMLNDLKNIEEIDNNESFSLLKTLTVFADNLFISKAHALPLMGLGALGVTAAVALKVVVVSKVAGQLFTNPIARMALSTVLTANAVMAKSKASKEADKAKDRKSFLEKLREQVAESGAGLNCGSADAAQASANCKSTTPIGVTPDGASFNPGLASGTFGTTPNGADAVLGTPKCITNTGSYDPNCSCKSKNTCLNISGSLSGSVPSGVSLGSVPSDLDSITGGTLAGANLDEASLTSSAARLNKLNQDIAKKNPAIAKANADANKQADEITKSLADQIGLSGGSLASAGNSRNDSVLNANSPTEALEQLKDELKQEIGKVESTGSVAAPSGLDLSGIGGVSVEETPTLKEDTKLAEVMGSEFEMGNNDINTESSSNIFDIVSNRYRRSGIRRLFGAEQIIPTDTASPTDINR